MGRLEDLAQRIRKVMDQRENIRNLGIVAHIDHGKTTMLDSLVAAAGLLSEDLAGEARFLDYYGPEHERIITIYAKTFSMVYNYQGKDHLINIIDTPGHVDFSGEVIRAMRAVDGVVLVVCAVEGVMPQTETVLRMALAEKVKPVLFINKVDRLIKELRLTPEEMQERFIKIITEVNSLIRKNAPEEFRDQWYVNVNDGSVAFGSAIQGWAVSVPQMKRTGITFKDVYTHIEEDRVKELEKKSPLYDAVLEMIINHLPSPLVAQKYRIPHIWPGDMESEVGKSLSSCDPKGKFVMVVTDVSVDPHAGDIATGRVWSGTVRKGMDVYIINQGRKVRIQQVGVFIGPHRVPMEEIPAGNIASLVGFKDVYAGETIAEVEIPPFEHFKTKMEPVVTMAVEAKNPKEMTKLVEVLHKIQKEDPNVVVEINRETGEHLISGMGELHLEIKRYAIEHDYGIEIEVSPPIVVYRESVGTKGPTVEGKSPNKHNKFYIHVEPLEPKVLEALINKELPEGRYKGKEHVNKFVELGMSRDDAKNIWDVYMRNVFVDRTKGVQYLNETKELILQAFEEAMKDGPLAREKCMGVKVVLDDAVLHEDAVHRGPAQVIPAVKRAIYASMLMADPYILEPKQKLFIYVPQDYMGAVTKVLQMRRAQVMGMNAKGDQIEIVAVAPVRELLEGFASELRSATQGRAYWFTEFWGFDRVPKELQPQIIKEIRTRKGLTPEPPKPEDFMG